MEIKFSKQLQILSLTLSAMLGMDIGIATFAYVPHLETAQKANGGDEVLVAGLTFSVPNIRASKNRTAGASRGTSCGHNAQSAQALLPSTQIGLTVAASPTLFVNLPQPSTQLAEFALTESRDGKLGKEVYRTIIELPDQPGVVSMKLPKEKATSSPLEIGKIYHWEFSLICDPSDRARDIVIEGEIQRVELSQNLANQLETAAPNDRPAVFAQAGLWYDTVASLAQLREDNPNDPQLAEDWKTLLHSVGLDTTITQAPLVGPLTQMKN
jgi:hypothetical protein